MKPRPDDFFDHESLTDDTGLPGPALAVIMTIGLFFVGWLVWSFFSTLFEL